jgi:parvulin-like peptidyl-prolyl isomerase
MKRLFGDFFSIFFLLLFSMSAIFHSGCDRGEKKNVIAVINDMEITVDLLETYFLENLNGDLNVPDAEGIDQTEEEINKVKSRLLEDFIDAQLMVEQAEKAGISISDKETVRFLQELGESIEIVAEVDQKKRGWVKNLMIIQKFKNERIFSDIAVSEKELKQYFQKQIRKKSERQRFLLEIIVMESEKEAQNILKKLKAKRAKFDDFIEKYAMIQGKTSSQAYFLDELPENIEEEVSRMKKGDISKVLPLLKRFCIIKMEGIEKGGTEPFEKISGDLRKKLIREKKEAVFEEYIQNLRKNSEVKIFYKKLPFDFIADR